MTELERLAKARQSGKFERDQQLLIDLSKRKASEKIEQDERFEGILIRQRALRLVPADAERMASRKATAASRIGGAPAGSEGIRRGRRYRPGLTPDGISSLRD